MRFGDTPIDEATGAILAHSWRANGVNFAKGRVLSGDDVAKLRAAGVSSIVAARLDPDDMHEDEAAATLAKALAGQGIEVTAQFSRQPIFARGSRQAPLRRKLCARLFHIGRGDGVSQPGERGLRAQPIRACPGQQFV